jgi:hypothetical protein
MVTGDIRENRCPYKRFGGQSHILLEQAKKEGNLKSLRELCSVFGLLVGLMDVSAREKNMLERKRTDYENCLKRVNGIKDSWGDNQTVQLALQEYLQQVDRHEGLRRWLLQQAKLLEPSIRRSKLLKLS